MISRGHVRELAASLRQNRIPAPSFRIEFRLFEEQPVGEIGRIKIYIDGKREQHKEKHFHARINDEAKGSFRIPDGFCFGSSLKSRDDRTIMEWAKVHGTELEAAWDAVEKGETPIRIEEQI